MSITNSSPAGPKPAIFVVTRLKENANYWDFEDRPLPKSSSNVLKDQLIRLNPITSGAPCKEDSAVW